MRYRKAWSLAVFFVKSLSLKARSTSIAITTSPNSEFRKMLFSVSLYFVTVATHYLQRGLKYVVIDAKIPVQKIKYAHWLKELVIMTPTIDWMAIKKSQCIRTPSDYIAQ